MDPFGSRAPSVQPPSIAMLIRTAATKPYRMIRATARRWYEISRLVCADIAGVGSGSVGAQPEFHLAWFGGGLGVT